MMKIDNSVLNKVDKEVAVKYKCAYSRLLELDDELEEMLHDIANTEIDLEIHSTTGCLMSDSQFKEKTKRLHELIDQLETLYVLIEVVEDMFERAKEVVVSDYDFRKRVGIIS